MSLLTQKFVVIDTETTGTDHDKDRVVELAYVPMTGSTVGAGASWLVNPGMPIPATASAIHHLTDADVATAPTLTSLIQKTSLPVANTVLVAHNANFDKGFLPFLHEPWLCTMRLAKHLYPDAPGHSNQVLRYWLNLNLPVMPEGIPPHRALPDACVTAALLSHLLTAYIERFGDTSVENLMACCYSPIRIERMPFGKHKDTPLAQVPRDYLRWVLSNKNDDFDLVASIRRVLAA
jgi:exodeoxyribonuclease X